MSRNIWIGVVVVVIIAGGTWWYIKSESVQPDTTSTTGSQTKQTTGIPSEPSQTTQTQSPTLSASIDQKSLTAKQSSTAMISGKVSNLPEGDQVAVALTKGYSGASDWSSVHNWIVGGGSATDFGVSNSATVQNGQWTIELPDGSAGTYNVYVYDFTPGTPTATLLTTGTLSVN